MNYIPYLVHNAHHCKPRKPSGTRIFCSPSKDLSKNTQSGVPDRSVGRNWPKTELKKSRIPTVATPSDNESAEDDNIARIDDVEADSPDPSGLVDDQSFSGDEADGRYLRLAELSLREESNSLYHLLTHKPNIPFCESCRRAKMK